MTVKIKTAGATKWYKNKIGEIFTVKPFSDGKDFILLKEGEETPYYFSGTDCIIINNEN